MKFFRIFMMFSQKDQLINLTREVPRGKLTYYIDVEIQHFEIIEEFSIHDSYIEVSC
jgi:hypothetical protein